MDKAREIELTAPKRAKRRVKAARWDLDVAVFFFALVSIVLILEFEGVGIEVVAPTAACGLALGWIMGWEKGRLLYKTFYIEELTKLQQEQLQEQTIDGMVQKALRVDWKTPV